MSDQATTVTDEEMLRELGADGRAWAKEFSRIAQRMGYQPMRADWLENWFTSAIGAGYDECDRQRREDAPAAEAKDRVEGSVREPSENELDGCLIAYRNIVGELQKQTPNVALNVLCSLLAQHVTDKTPEATIVEALRRYIRGGGMLKDAK